MRLQSHLRRCCVSRATQIKTYSWDSAQVVLVGNKLDLEEDRQVPRQDGQRVATELGEHSKLVCLQEHSKLLHQLVHFKKSLFSSCSTGFQFFEASAKDNINVKQVFDRLVDVICEKMNQSFNGDASPSVSQKGDGLQEQPPPSQGGCACWFLEKRFLVPCQTKISPICRNMSK